MRKFFGYLRFLLAVLYIQMYSISGFVINIFGSGSKYLRKKLWSKSQRLIDITGSKMTVYGLENIKKDKTYLFLGNHRSYTDIVALFAATGQAERHISFMAKKELFKVPFLGSAMKYLDTIGVERGESSKALKSLITAVEYLKAGKSVVIFPEGTRSKDGHTLSPFKKGSFTIARRAGVNILPFVLEGTEVYMPKGEFALYKADVVVRFLPEVETAGKQDADLMNEVESIIKEALCQK